MDFHEMSNPVFWKQKAHGPRFAYLIKTAFAYQPQSLVLEKKIFFTIFGHGRSCSMARNNSNKLSMPFWQKALCEIWWKLLKQFQKRRHLRIIWWLWWPSWISDQHNLSYFWSRGHLVATVKFSNLPGSGGCQKLNRYHFSILCSPELRRLHMKIKQSWLSGFRGEVIWKC